MITRFNIIAVLVFLALPGARPWDKTPEKWNLADVSRILQDSPWSPASVKLEREVTSRYADPRTGTVSDSPGNVDTTNPVPGVQLSRSKPQPEVPVLWWSSKTIRLAKLRLRQLSDPALAAQPLAVEDLPDYVLALEGSEAQRILKDAKEDLHDSVFLELPSGMTLDPESVRFVEGGEGEEARTEFHFPKMIDGRATIDASLERVVFHCKASAKAPRPGRRNTIAIRAGFKPGAMRVRGVADL